MFLRVKTEHLDLFSTSKYETGRFKYFHVTARMDESMNFTRQRTRILPPSAVCDIQKYIDDATFIQSQGGEDKYCSNIVLTKRPQNKETRDSSQADKNINKINEKNNKQKQEMTEQKQLYRVTVDLRLQNRAMLNDSLIALPSIQSIENKFKNKICSTTDISNMFFSIALEDSSVCFFNIYFVDSIITHKYCPMGWKSSPRYACLATDATFQDQFLMVIPHKC